MKPDSVPAAAGLGNEARRYVRSIRMCRTLMGKNALGISGDVSDEAKRNIPTIGDRVSEVGSRDSGKPRAQPISVNLRV